MRMLTWSIRVPLKAYRRTGDDSRERLRPATTRSPRDRRAVGARLAGRLTMSLLGPLLVHGNASTRSTRAPATHPLPPADWRFATPIKPWRDTIAGWELDQDDPTRHAHRAAPTPSCTSPGGRRSARSASARCSSSASRSTSRTPRSATRSRCSPTARGPRRRSPPTRSSSASTRRAPGPLANLREDITAIYAGPENAGRPALLPPGLDWKPVGHTAVEAALIEQRKSPAKRSRVYQIPPPMLGHPRPATYSNIETQREMAYTDGLAPPLVLIEQTINAQLVRGLLREDDVYVEFDFAGVLRGDRLKEVEALREAIGTGLLTPNEARAIDNRPRSTLEGMDEFYLPRNNLQPIDRPPRRRAATTRARPAGA
jgi:hypothetical protein